MGHLWARIGALVIRFQAVRDEPVGVGLVSLKDLCVEAVQHGDAVPRAGGDLRWDGVILGLVSIGAGLVAAYHPAATALLIVLIMGANALVVGVLDILAAIRLRRTIAGEWLLALAGLASIVFGALVFARPGAGALALVWLVSLYAFVTGAFLLGLGLRMRTLGRTRGPEHDRRVLPDRRLAPAR